MTELPESWRHYLNGDYCPLKLWKMFCTESQIVFLVLLYLFYAICGLSVYPIDHVINPEPQYGLHTGGKRWTILFGPSSRSAWENILVWFMLFRVVRQANYVGFWTVVGLVTRWSEGREHYNKKV